jgi:acyl carrier protein
LQRIHKQFNVDIPETDDASLRTLDDVVRYADETPDELIQP